MKAQLRSACLSLLFSLLFPARKVGVVVMMNCDSSPHQKILGIVYVTVPTALGET